MQRSIIKIQSKVDKLNEDVERNKFFFEKTFDSSLTENTRDIINMNIKSGYRDISNFSRDIVDLISEVQENL